MDDLLLSLGLSADVGLVISVYVVLVLAAFWLAMIIWAYRDMRSRSREFLSQIGVLLLVALFNVAGLLIYLFLRPRETLAEAYERSLEEEALLQEIEEKPTCPGCGQRVQDNWQACPHCFTRLKKSCVHCRQMLELSWQICPYCTTQQPGYTEQSAVNHVRPATIPENGGGNTGQVRRRTTATRSSAQLEFLEED